LLFGNTKTSFKIGGAVGIIILMLGIAVLFGLIQMFKMSQEIIEISEEFVPLNKIITQIQYQKLNQDTQLEKILHTNELKKFDELAQAKDEFWQINAVINSDITKGKSIAQTGFDFALSESSKSKFFTIHQKISEISLLHDEYEVLAEKLFEVIDAGESSSMSILLSNLEKTEVQLENEMVETIDLISGFTEEATLQIETNERDSLYGQIVIVSVVGAIAATLGFFINQINSDLKKEVETKTIELKEANEKLKELDRLKDEFIGIASHELKSPIQPIIGFAELAKTGDIDQKEAWEGVTELASRLQDLANAVLDVSKIESNRLVLHLEKIRINDVISEVVKTFRINKNSNLKFQENLDENIEVELDKIRFEQVLRNLLTNAVRFTNEGTITVTTHVYREENKIQVKVTDSGRGIPNDLLPKIFEKFVTKGINQEKSSGTGLGLFLCRGIIQAHGGDIFAYNNNDSGATFEFFIPIIHENKLQEIPQVFRN
jgi:signal transduction histidine kinase